MTDLRRELEVFLVSGGAVKQEEGFREPGRTNLFGLRIPAEGPHHVVGKLLGSLDRSRVAHGQPVMRQPEQQILLLVQSPIAMVLPPPGFGLERPDIAVGVSRFEDALDEMGRLRRAR